MNYLLKELIKETYPPRLIACSGKGFSQRDIVEAEKYGAIAFELRFDLLQKEYTSEFEKILTKNLATLDGKKIVITARSKREGGFFSGTKKERESLYLRYLKHVFAVDIELAELSQHEKLLDNVKQEGKLIIGSYHNFKTVPPLKKLHQLVTIGKKYQVDIVKIAGYADHPKQLLPLLQFQCEGEMPLSLMTMGKTALFSRVLFANIGSVFTYSAIGTPTAPNQPTCKQIYKYTKMFFPEKEQVVGKVLNKTNILNEG
ncbi:MAG: type I 3-dehydroquinate dehydratase [Candidatus Hydrogenedens sp.]|nr:type I 3-dehydroquinate dehydratase [Candidatus Hydrogenedens sp.]